MQVNHIRDSSKLSWVEKISELLKKSEEIQNCPYKNDSIHAKLLRIIGGVYYGQSDFLNAAKYYNLSIDLIRAGYNSPAVDRMALLSSYFWLAKFYQLLGNRPKQIEAINNCIEAAKDLNSYNDISSIQALNIKTENCFDLGDYHNCITYARMCEKFSWECADANKNNKGNYDRANECALSSIEWNVEALLKLKHYKEASEFLNNNFEELKKRGDKRFYGVIYDQMAQVEMHNKNCKKALTLLNQSLASEDEVGNYFNCKQELNTIAYDIYFNYYNDNDNALAFYRKALGYSYRDKSILQKDSMESLLIYDRMAKVYVKERRFDLAFKYFQIAFDQIKPGINETDILHLPAARIKELEKIEYLTALLTDKGDAFQKQYEITSKPDALSEAIRVYKISDKFLDMVKNESFDVNSKLFWRNTAQRLYENAIHASCLQNNFVDAFYFFERSRAVLLNDDLNERRWVGENDIMKETQLEKKILQIQQMMNDTTNKSSKNYSQLEDDLFNSRQDLQKLKELIKTNNPLYYQSFFEKTPVAISDIQNIVLKDHQALVELFNGDSAVYMIVITKAQSYLKEINKTVFDSLSFRFKNYLSNRELLNKDFNNYVKLSQQFYQLMFQNINLPTGRIIISPGGKYFPFEALVTNTKPLTYFLDDHAVSYTYSARYLLSTFATTSTDQTFLGVAPLKFSNLPSLEGSDVSINKVQNYFSHATSYIGHAASKNNFLNEFPKYRIIQLYTHAAGNEYSGDPVIYFADSTLNLSDLLLEKKPATDLVVLSACETASGKLYGGEGVFSFNRSFAALGIPSSVSNLWEIDNKATYKITELFYKYLAQGIPLDIALQKAKKELKATSESKLPYYWAAPILVGKADAISLPKNNEWKWMTGIASIAALFLGAWMIRKRNQSLTKKSSNAKSP